MLNITADFLKQESIHEASGLETHLKFKFDSGRKFFIDKRNDDLLPCIMIVKHIDQERQYSLECIEIDDSVSTPA